MMMRNEENEKLESKNDKAVPNKHNKKVCEYHLKGANTMINVHL